MNYNTIQQVIKNFKGQNLALEIFRHSLIKQQRMIFDAIPLGVEYAMTVNEIASSLNLETKNVSTQLRQIQAKFGKIKSVKINKKTNKYYL